MIEIESLAGAIRDAERLIRPHVRETPVAPSVTLSEATGADVWLKCENFQITGSFKVRGATNRLLALSEDARRKGVVAASSGNHGIAVAHAGRALGIPVTVYVPEFVSPAKATAIRRLGAVVVVFGTDGLDTEIKARRRAESNDQCYVSPYNDLAVVAGQGTIGPELRRQLPDVRTVIVAVGGGGLISGIAADLRHHAPDVRVIGAQPARSKVMTESVRAGRVVDVPSLPTLSDGTAGGLEPDSITFGLCRSLVDEWIEVAEEDIAAAMRHAIQAEHMLVEGAAAVAIAALLKIPALSSERVVIVLCGANIGAAELGQVLGCRDVQ
jgi:threonine dehydratase